ncbi:MAG: ASKHA domain-containing protein [Candidatus Firestonebacteria bacterium]
MSKIKVIFQPEGKKIHIHQNITIAAAIHEANINLDFPCGAVGKCGKCKVEIEGNVSPVDYIEQELLSKEEMAKGIRLACRTKILGNVVISIPGSSRLQTQKILDSGMATQVCLKPAVKKTIFSFENVHSLKEKIRKSNLKLSIKLESFKDVIKKSKGFITAIIMNEELVSLESKDTTGELYGMAFDIGTTTVVGTLVELNTGLIKGVSADMNPQVVYGDDVISRLDFCIQNKNGLKNLNNKIIHIINKIITEACEEADIMPDKIYDVVFAGNTTMEHLLLKVEPSSLAVYPFTPKLGQSIIRIKPKQLNININPEGLVNVFPIIGGWVGGDTVGVILATDLHKSKDIKLAIDIGTNGEVVLGNSKKLLCASCAAGPAFEGAHIKHGMRASNGAIERIDIINGQISYKTIGDTLPRGFCGSGLIDAMASLVENNIVDVTGRIKSPDELKDILPQELRSRIRVHENGNEFVFVEDDDKKITLNQKDIREIQLAKGAMLAGITILMKELGIGANEIKEVLIAGAFGNYIRAEKALAIGLIPQISLEKIIFCGNAAEEGARKALVSVDSRKEAEEIAKNVKYVDLSSSPCFQDIFADSMMFPKIEKHKEIPFDRT